MWSSCWLVSLMKATKMTTRPTSHDMLQADQSACGCLAGIMRISSE